MPADPGVRRIVDGFHQRFIIEKDRLTFQLVHEFAIERGPGKRLVLAIGFNHVANAFGGDMRTIRKSDLDEQDELFAVYGERFEEPAGCVRTQPSQKRCLRKPICKLPQKSCSFS